MSRPATSNIFRHRGSAQQAKVDLMMSTLHEQCDSYISTQDTTNQYLRKLLYTTKKKDTLEAANLSF
jgi:hypothetical protein